MLNILTSSAEATSLFQAILVYLNPPTGLL